MIGQTADEMDTPALLIDLDVMERNLSRMADFFRGAKAGLRAHTKVHRCPVLAHRQVKAGAKGICCQKVGEAEVMAEAGIGDIIVTNQIVTPLKIRRLLALAGLSRITVPVDDPGNANLLSRMAEKAGVKLDVLVDVHMGSQRCGVEPGRPAVKLANRVRKLKGLRLRGLMGFEGHISWVMPREKRREECEKLESKLIETRRMLEREN
ncbi:MAG: alanine racemase, partial [Candidatus Bathyarchaeia archaeon]